MLLIGTKHLPRDGSAKLQTLLDHYGSGDNPVVDAEECRAEWQLFSTFLQQECHDVPAANVLGKLAVEETLKMVYPNLSKLATICLTSPVSNAECERVFSTLKRVKTRLRSTLKNKTLNHLIRIAMEGPELEKFDFDCAVDKWASLRNRRISVVRSS